MNKAQWYSSVPAKGEAVPWNENRVDPDGVIRYRNTDAERAQYVRDLQNELRFANDVPGLRVLDFGAGAGWFLAAMSSRLAKHGMEIDESAVAMWPKSIERIFEFGADTESAYDLVICHHVIEHCDRPEDILSNLYCALRDRGLLIFATPDFDSPCAKRFGPAYRMLHDPTHISLFSRASAERFLTDHLFTILDVQYPFPERYATAKNFARWNDTQRVSPPWPGNWMTFYCRR